MSSALSATKLSDTQNSLKHTELTRSSVFEKFRDVEKEYDSFNKTLQLPTEAIMLVALSYVTFGDRRVRCAAVMQCDN